ncbi:MAG: glycosyltransferase family 39 protein [Microcoleaceae cyanobacterium]
MGVTPLTRVSSKDSRKQSSVTQRQQWTLLIAIVVLAAVLRFYQLGTESIWIDEHFSIRDAENLKLGTRPLYYLLLHLWMKLGSSDAWLRTLSIPFSLGCIVLTYLLSRRLLSTSVGLLAALMMSISPLFVGYGQEIRMYSLSTFFGIWGSLILANILLYPQNIRPLRILGWMLVRLLGVMTTPLNILMLMPDTLLLFWRFRHNRKVMISFVVGLIMAGILWLPFAQVLQEAAPRFMGGWVMYQPKPDIVLIPAMLTGVTVFWPLGDLPSLTDLSFTLSGWGWDETVMLYYMAYTGVAVFVLAIGLLQLIRTSPRQNATQAEYWWIAAWGFLPTIVIGVVSAFSGSIWRERYLIFAVPYFLILLAVGFLQLWQHYRKVAITVAMIYAIAVGGGLSHYYTTLYHDDWRGISQLIRTNEQPGDVIGFYAADWEPRLTIPRYYEGNAEFHVMERDPLPRPKDPKTTDIFIQEMLQGLPPTSSRYWIVVYEPWSGGMKRIRKMIDEKYDLLDYQTFPNSVNAAPEVFLVAPKI